MIDIFEIVIVINCVIDVLNICRYSLELRFSKNPNDILNKSFKIDFANFICSATNRLKVTFVNSAFRIVLVKNRVKEKIIK
jgi:hypothetical protein